MLKSKTNSIMKKNLLTVGSITVFSLFGLTTFAQMTKPNPGINLEFMDRTVKPGDDFFRFVNGTWYDKTEIPADKTRWGSFDELRQNTDKDALAILKEAASKKLDPKSDQAKAVNVYRTFMDTLARNKQGIKPLKPYLAKINAIKSVAEVNKLITEMTPEGGLGFYSAGIGPDAKNSNRNVVYISLGSVGLPDRDYYVSDDKDSKEKREKYVAHVARMLQFLGEKPEIAKQNAEKVLALETEMARPRLDRVERRDRRKTYNPMTVADLQKMTPSVNWNGYLQGIGIGKIDSLVVSQ
jgi:putative endopeptidase